MTAPVDANRLTSSTASSTTSTPTISVVTHSAGDLLIATLQAHNAAITGTPGGWTTLASAVHNLQEPLYVGYRVSDGTEGSTITVNLNSAVKSCGVMWAITGHDPATPPEISSLASGTTSPVDPGTVTPSGGAKDYLVVWIGGVGGASITAPPSGNPTNYSNPVGIANTGNPSGSRAASFGATRQLSAASSENPPSWAISASGSWGAYAVAVYPAPPAGFIPRYPAINFQDPAVLAKAWKRTRGIFVPKLWTPEGATI